MWGGGYRRDLERGFSSGGADVYFTDQIVIATAEIYADPMPPSEALAAMANRRT